MLDDISGGHPTYTHSRSDLNASANRPGRPLPRTLDALRPPTALVRRPAWLPPLCTSHRPRAQPYHPVGPTRRTRHARSHPFAAHQVPPGLRSPARARAARDHSQPRARRRRPPPASSPAWLKPRCRSRVRPKGTAVIRSGAQPARATEPTIQPARTSASLRLGRYFKWSSARRTGAR